MQYKDVRPLIRSGDLLAFSHGSWKSFKEAKVNAVRIFTRSTYSHVGVAWVVGGRVFVIEAVMPKIRIFPLSKEGDFYLMSMEVEWKEETEEFALSTVGEKYSQFNAIKAFFKELEAGNVSECAALAREIYLLEDIDLGELSRPDTVVFAAQRLGKKMLFIHNGGNIVE